MIYVEKLTRRFGEHTIIKNVSFGAQAGEVLGLLGPTGAGKSTLMKIMTGLLPPTSGKVELSGFDVDKQKLQALRQLGYMPERATRYANMDVHWFLDFVAELRGIRGTKKSKNLSNTVERLKLQNILTQPIGSLSWELKQRVGLAQAIVHEPKLLVLDEPTNGLNPDQRQTLHNIIKSLSTDTTIIFSTTCADEITAICSRALIMYDGRLLADNTIPELRKQSRYHNAVTIVSEKPLDYLALAVLPGVAGIEEQTDIPGAITILATPGATISPKINALIAARQWVIKHLTVNPGSLNEVIESMFGKSN